MCVFTCVCVFACRGEAGLSGGHVLIGLVHPDLTSQCCNSISEVEEHRNDVGVWVIVQ